MSVATDNPVRVVFDLDGTLVDSLGSLAAAGARLCEEMGRPTVPAEQYEAFVGRGIMAQVVDLMTTTGGLPDDGGQAACRAASSASAPKNQKLKHGRYWSP